MILWFCESNGLETVSQCLGGKSITAEISTHPPRMRLLKLNLSSYFPLSGTSLFYKFRAELWQTPTCLMHLVSHFFHLIKIQVSSITSKEQKIGHTLLWWGVILKDHVWDTQEFSISTFLTAIASTPPMARHYWCLSDWNRGIKRHFYVAFRPADVANNARINPTLYFCIPAIAMAYTVWMQEGTGGHLWMSRVPPECLCYKEALCSCLELTCCCSCTNNVKIVITIQHLSNILIKWEEGRGHVSAKPSPRSCTVHRFIVHRWLRPPLFPVKYA